MSVLGDLERLEVKHYAIIFSIILAVLCPGLSIIVIYRFRLLETLDVLKLVFLSSSLTLPVFIVNVVLVWVFTMKDGDDSEGALFMGSFFSAAAYYIALLIAFFCHFAFKSFLHTLGIMQVAIFAFMLFDHLHDAKKEAKKKRQEQPGT